MLTCESCKQECDELHKHHIVPKSRGGSEDDSNLIELCLTCHGKAHDVSFKSKDGVVSSGIDKSKKATELSHVWSDEGGLYRTLDNLFDVDEELYKFLLSGLLLELIDATFFFQIIHPEFETKRSCMINIQKHNMEKIRKCYASI